MTADVETIVAAGASVHDMWANMLELPVGIYLLYRQVGKPSLLVLVPTVSEYSMPQLTKLTVKSQQLSAASSLQLWSQRQ